MKTPSFSAKQRTRCWLTLGVLIAFIASLGISLSAGAEIFWLLRKIPLLGVIAAAFVIVTGLITCTLIACRSIYDILCGEHDPDPNESKEQQASCVKHLFKGFTTFFAVSNALAESTVTFSALRACGVPLVLSVLLSLVTLALNYLFASVELRGILSVISRNLLGRDYFAHAPSKPPSNFRLYAGITLACVVSITTGLITALSIAAIVPPPFGIGLAILYASLVIAANAFIYIQSVFEASHVDEATKRGGVMSVLFWVYDKRTRTQQQLMLGLLSVFNASGVGLELYSSLCESTMLEHIPVIAPLVRTLGRTTFAVIAAVAALVVFTSITWGFCQRLFRTTTPSPQPEQAIELSKEIPTGNHAPSLSATPPLQPSPSFLGLPASLDATTSTAESPGSSDSGGTLSAMPPETREKVATRGKNRQLPGYHLFCNTRAAIRNRNALSPKCQIVKPMSVKRCPSVT